MLSINNALYRHIVLMICDVIYSMVVIISLYHSSARQPRVRSYSSIIIIVMVISLDFTVILVYVCHYSMQYNLLWDMW